MTRFPGRTLVGEIEILKAPGGKDLKPTLSGEEARPRRSGDVEKGGMRSGLTGEMKTDQGAWEMTMRESLLLDQMMTGSPGVAWMMTEALDVLMKSASLVAGQMMTGLPGVVQMMIGLLDALVMTTGEAGVTQMMTDHLDEDWMTIEEAGEQPMRTEDQDVGWMRTGGRGEEVLTMNDHPGVTLMMTGVPGGPWMMTEDLGGMQMMIEFPGVVQTTIGDLGETWMMIGCRDAAKMIGFPGGVMTRDLVPGDHLSSQVDGERKKKPEKRVGVHLENQDHQKNVNGIETKKGIETVKIERRTTRTLTGKGTEREMGTERIVSEDPGMRVAGEEDQLRNLRAGEIQVAVMIGKGMTVVVREMIDVI